MKYSLIPAGLLLALCMTAPLQAEQTILKAYAPPGSDGTSIILVIDWAQVKAHAAQAQMVMLRRRPAGPPTVADTLVFLPADSSRYVDTGLSLEREYHYFAYFKAADSSTTQFGSTPAVVHLGPIRTRPQH